MVYIYLFIYLYEFIECRSVEINLHCRDDYDQPVDWWFIYKPALDVSSFLDRGRNYSYITAENLGRWQSSPNSITESSMLRKTLLPIYTTTYLDHLAFATYGDNRSTQLSAGSSGMGVLMADSQGGVLVVHTVPGFPSLGDDSPVFPEKQTLYGHLLVCLSLPVTTLNEIGSVLRNSNPNFTVVHVPRTLQPLLKDWINLHKPIRKNEKLPLSFDFLTRYKSMRGHVAVRPPRQSVCLYRTFAKRREIIIDVYGREPLEPVCFETYGLRPIKQISVKYTDNVHYVRPRTDKAMFGVSTAAHWQRRGGGPAQYWACVSSLDAGDKGGRGGQMLCFDSYDVWASFDNMKIAEPTCPES